MYNQRGQSAEGPIPESPSSNLSKKVGGKLYKNPLDCLIQTVRAEGPLAVYKVQSFRCLVSLQGFFAHLLRIAPHTILYGSIVTLLILELLHSWSRLVVIEITLIAD